MSPPSNRKGCEAKATKRSDPNVYTTYKQNAESDSRSLSPPSNRKGCERNTAETLQRVFIENRIRRNEQIILTGFRERSKEGFSVKIVVKLQLAAQAEESNERSFFIVKNNKNYLRISKQ